VWAKLRNPMEVRWRWPFPCQEGFCWMLSVGNRPLVVRQLVVHLLAVIQQQAARIAALDAR
jgi:hypothetical protein